MVTHYSTLNALGQEMVNEEEKQKTNQTKQKTVSDGQSGMKKPGWEVRKGAH